MKRFTFFCLFFIFQSQCGWNNIKMLFFGVLFDYNSVFSYSKTKKRYYYQNYKSKRSIFFVKIGS